MANYIVSYDLNGPNPSHATMDAHMRKQNWTCGRILETVWYVGTSITVKGVYDHVNSILSANDRLIVVEAGEAAFRNLLIGKESFLEAWKENA